MTTLPLSPKQQTPGAPGFSSQFTSSTARLNPSLCCGPSMHGHGGVEKYAAPNGFRLPRKPTENEARCDRGIRFHPRLLKCTIMYGITETGTARTPRYFPKPSTKKPRKKNSTAMNRPAYKLSHKAKSVPLRPRLRIHRVVRVEGRGLRHDQDDGQCWEKRTWRRQPITVIEA